MNDKEAQQCYESMLKFIHKQGQDKADQIQAQTKEEFKKERENFIAAEQERITSDFKTRLAQDQIKLKIQRSANENAARIQKMKTVNTLIENLYKDAKALIIYKQRTDKAEYQVFLKNLIVQVRDKFKQSKTCRVLSSSWRQKFAFVADRVISN